MESFHSRLIDEQIQLAGRISRLTAFLDNPEKVNKIDKTNAILLSVQLKAMQTYDECLKKRLALLQ
jgi:crAss001_48 related protein